MFDAVPPQFDVPKLLSVDERNFITVVSRIEGTALREGRYLTVPLESQHVEPLILTFASLSSYVPAHRPKDSVVYEQLGDRFERYSKLGLIRPNDVALLRALSTSGVSPVFGHGDPLPSNVLFMDSKYYLIDWEFGDFFLPGYDLAGLHTFAIEDPKLQHSIIDFVTAQGPDFKKSFMLNLANILSREVRTHSELPDESEAKPRLPKLKARLQETQTVIDMLI